MIVRIILSLVCLIVCLSVAGNSLEVSSAYNDYLPGIPPKAFYPKYRQFASSKIYQKSSLQKSTRPPKKYNERLSPTSHLEIVKSVELQFDPKTQTLVPVTETTAQTQKNDENLLLFSWITYKKLQKIFRKYEMENSRGKSGYGDGKNFQTGRFKPKRNKNRQRFVVSEF